MIGAWRQAYSRSSCSRSLLSLLLLRSRLELDDEDPVPIGLPELLLPRLLLPRFDDDPLLPCCCWRDCDPLDGFLLDDWRPGMALLLGCGTPASAGGRRPVRTGLASGSAHRSRGPRIAL